MLNWIGGVVDGSIIIGDARCGGPCSLSGWSIHGRPRPSGAAYLDVFRPVLADGLRTDHRPSYKFEE